MDGVERETSMCTEIRKRLLAEKEEEFAAFQRKLMPTINAESVLGVRTPILRKMAKELIKNPETAVFLDSIPHAYFDENQLHIFLLGEIKDFEETLQRVEAFLPYIDNWATCDQLSPKAFKKNPEKLLPVIEKWLQSDQTYTVRFGIGMLMEHFLGDRFDRKYPEMIQKIHSKEYYINMMIAWYFATALAKQYDAIIPIIEAKKLDVWVHNKSIQKAIESNRITKEQKTYLRALKIKTP